MKRLRAVVPRPHRDAGHVEDGREVRRVDAVDVEGAQRRAGRRPRRGPVHPDALHAGDAVVKVPESSRRHAGAFQGREATRPESLASQPQATLCPFTPDRAAHPLLTLQRRPRTDALCPSQAPPGSRTPHPGRWPRRWRVSRPRTAWEGARRSSGRGRRPAAVGQGAG